MASQYIYLVEKQDGVGNWHSTNVSCTTAKLAEEYIDSVTAVFHDKATYSVKTIFLLDSVNKPQPITLHERTTDYNVVM